MAMLQLHTLNQSRSQRILWFLEETGTSYEIISHRRNRLFEAPKSVQDIHPLGRLPILVDDGQVVVESAVILEYLAKKFLPAWQREPSADDYWDYQFWLHFTEGSVAMPLFALAIFNRGQQASTLWKPFNGLGGKILEKSYFGRAHQKNMQLLENHLESQPFLLGESISICDVQLAFWLDVAITRGVIQVKHYPVIVDYVRSYQQRSAYQQALSKEPDYAFADRSE